VSCLQHALSRVPPDLPSMGRICARDNQLPRGHAPICSACVQSNRAQLRGEGSKLKAVAEDLLNMADAYRAHGSFLWSQIRMQPR
jgi:hypothetical protein